ncbi:hypothetical protein QPX29_07595, partial [Corynebacterium accolens]|uniref:hypothetical protein n=1 Tax=Corynebacterium accolens TaxID=38284 RepID=UPI00254395AA
QTNQHTTMHTKIKNKYIGTLLSSQTSSPHNSYMLKSMELVASKNCFCQGLFSYRRFSQKQFLVSVGRCRSR